MAFKRQKIGKTKQPYCFEVNEGELFAFAGLWGRWKDPSDESLETCSILTTTPNTVTSAVHDRMPVILDPSSYDLWLDLGFTNVVATSMPIYFSWFLMAPLFARLAMRTISTYRKSGRLFILRVMRMLTPGVIASFSIAPY